MDIRGERTGAARSPAENKDGQTRRSKPMKKKLSILLALCLLLALPALAYTDNNIIAHRAPGDVTIDGNLGEWNTESAAVMNTAEQVVRDVGQWTDESDLSVQAYLMWDEENLYLGATILDDTPFMYREGFPPDMADSLVLFLSTDPEADPERAEYTANDFRLTMVIDDYYYNTGIDRDMIADNQGFESAGMDGDMQVLTGYECAVEEIEGGYTFESVIPLANFSNDNIPALVPEAGMTLGLDFGMFDLDFPCPGVATVRIQWNANADADTNPSLWGTVTLAE